MGNMYRISKDGTVREGMDLQIFSRTLTRMAQKDPNATFDPRQTWVYIEPGFGPAWITVHGADGVEPVRREEGDSEDMYAISPGTSLEVVHDLAVNGSHRFQVFPSGQSEHTLLHETATTGPQQAPLGAPEYVQQALDWLHFGEVGQSSLALVQHLILIPAKLVNPKKASQSTPSDNADWRRCWQVARQIPYIEQHIQDMAAVNDDWKDLVEPYEGSNGNTEWNTFMKKFDDNPPSAPRQPAPPSSRIKV